MNSRRTFYASHCIYDETASDHKWTLCSSQSQGIYDGLPEQNQQPLPKGERTLLTLSIYFAVSVGHVAQLGNACSAVYTRPAGYSTVPVYCYLSASSGSLSHDSSTSPFALVRSNLAFSFDATRRPTAARAQGPQIVE